MSVVLQPKVTVVKVTRPTPEVVVRRPVRQLVETPSAAPGGSVILQPKVTVVQVTDRRPNVIVQRPVRHVVTVGIPGPAGPPGPGGAVEDFIDPLATDIAPSGRAVAEALAAIVLTPGPAGKDGQIRFTGYGAPGVILGANPGDTYLDLNTGDIYKLT